MNPRSGPLRTLTEEDKKEGEHATVVPIFRFLRLRDSYKSKKYPNILLVFRVGKTPCAQKAVLMKAFEKATRRYAKEVSHLASNAVMASDEEYEVMSHTVAEARAAAIAAGDRVRRHISEHGCGDEIGEGESR